MVTLLGNDAYEAARHKTSTKLGPMKEALIAFATVSKSDGKKNQGKNTSKKNRSEK